MKEESPSGKFYEASTKYDLFLGQPWLHARRVLPMGHGTCFLKGPSASDPSDLYCTHSPKGFNTSRSEISFQFKKMGRNLQGIKRNWTEKTWNH